MYLHCCSPFVSYHLSNGIIPLYWSLILVSNHIVRALTSMFFLAKTVPMGKHRRGTEEKELKHGSHFRKYERCLVLALLAAVDLLF